MRHAVRMLVALLLLSLGWSAAAAQDSARRTCAGKNPDRAIEACNFILDRGRISPSVRVTALRFRGTAYVRKHEYSRAIADYSAALRIDSGDYRLYNLRGIAYRRTGDYDRAIADYNHALRLNPADARAWANRGVAFRWKGDYDRAIVDASEAIRIDPRAAAPRSSRAIAYRLKLDFRRALADHEAAIRLARNPAGYYYDRGGTYEAMGDYRKALADFRHAAALAPQKKIAAQAAARVERRLAQQPIVAAAPPAERTPAVGIGAAPNSMPPVVAAATPAPVAPAPVAPTPAKQVTAPASTKQAALQPKATTARPEMRVALLIGNSRYLNAVPLPNPKNDAEALAGALKGVGFTQVTLKLNLSREQVLNALKEFAAQAERADWAVVYFAGHGMELNGANYIIPVDAKLASDRDATFETVPLNQLEQTVGGARKLGLIILDACRDNPFLKTMTRSAARTRSIGKGLAAVEPDGPTLIAYAAKHGQVALDGANGNSPFVSSLIKNLSTPGLEINLLFRKVHDEVLGLTGGRQTPYTYGALPAEAFYFKKP